MHLTKPQLASIATLQTRSADTEHNKFKRALHDTIVKLKEYQACGVEPHNLIPHLVQDIYNISGTRSDKALNHIRNILTVSADRTRLSTAVSFITGKVSPVASHTKFLTLLAILHDRNSCVDDHGKIKSDKVIPVIKSLFGNSDKISFDKKQIEEIVFDYQFSETEHKVVLNEICFGKEYPSFNLAAHIKDDQNLDLNCIDELIKYGNIRFSKKYETGTFDTNPFGICAVSSYEYLIAEAKAYNGASKESKTQIMFALRNRRLLQHKNRQAQTAIKRDYERQISMAEKELRRNGFFKMNPIEGKHSELPELIRKAVSSLSENNQSQALCYIHLKHTESSDDPGHAMALSIAKKTNGNQNYFFLKFTDPNTDTGPVLLEIKEEDLQKTPLDFSKDIYYISQQLKLDSDVTIESYLPLPFPDDKEYALVVLKKLTSSHENTIQNRLSIEQILSTARWINEETIKELIEADKLSPGMIQMLLASRKGEEFHLDLILLFHFILKYPTNAPDIDEKRNIGNILKTIFIYQAKNSKLDSESISQYINFISEENRSFFVSDLLSEICVSKPFRIKTMKLFLDAIQYINIQDNFFKALLPDAIMAHKPDLTRLLISYLPKDQTTIDFLQQFMDEDIEGSRVETVLKEKIVEIQGLRTP